MEAAATAAPVRSPDVPRVVIMTPDPNLLPHVGAFLSGSFQAYLRETPVHILTVIKQLGAQSVAVDIDRLGFAFDNALRWVQELRRTYPDLAIVALTRSNAPDAKPRLAQAGADETLVAPVDLHELKGVLVRAVQARAYQQEARETGGKYAGPYSFCELIGGSEPMRRVYDAILRVAHSNTSVVIRGESGTGKELVARSIVAMGPRREKPFVKLNCAALPEPLIEAELFGHEKGSFTGAIATQQGQIELADGGTLFLDEIATLTLPLQSKLLRVLEDRAVTRVGGKTARKIDFRLLTATHENLEQMVKEERFRQDLYYRIHVIPIFLPPLRERPGDVALLGDHFLRMYCAANQVPIKRLDLEVLDVLEEGAWPGNVRELQNVIQRLVLMVEGRTIEVQHLPQQILASSALRHEKLLIPDEGIDFDEEMERIESAYVQAALRRAGGKKVLAAALLRVNHQRMKYLCRKHKAE